MNRMSSSVLDSDREVKACCTWVPGFKQAYVFNTEFCYFVYHHSRPALAPCTLSARIFISRLQDKKHCGPDLPLMWPA